MAASTGISARDLFKSYPPGVRALAGLTLEVEPATVFAVLGPNGAGKTTAVRILTTLTRPDSGTALVAGIDALAEPERVRRLIGVVGQKAGFDPAATGRQNLMLQGAIHDLRGRRLSRAVQFALERLRLSSVADRPARTYSGGMQRRLDIALGLLHEPRVLFLDEPTAGLDPEVRAMIWEEIARLASEDEITVLLTTHYLEEADELAERLAIVDRGAVVASGTPDALKATLMGDTVRIRVAELADSATIRDTLIAIAAVLDVTFDGSEVVLRATDGATAAPAALVALNDDGHEIESVMITRPSLSEVYLRFASRDDASDRRREG
jgi:ABC-2 type transport system ATP-binding protein